MPQATITARVNAQDKAAFDAFCSNVGLNASTAINLFVKAVLRERRIPFDIAQSSSFYEVENCGCPQDSTRIGESVREQAAEKE